VAGGWRRPHNEKLHNFALPNIISDQIKEDEVGRVWSMHGREGICTKFLLENLNRPLGRPRHRLKDSI